MRDGGVRARCGDRLEGEIPNSPVASRNDLSLAATSSSVRWPFGASTSSQRRKRVTATRHAAARCVHLLCSTLFLRALGSEDGVSAERDLCIRAHQLRVDALRRPCGGRSARAPSPCRVPAMPCRSLVERGCCDLLQMQLHIGRELVWCDEEWSFPFAGRMAKAETTGVCGTSKPRRFREPGDGIGLRHAPAHHARPSPCGCR